MSLRTPEKVEKLQKALHAKAKGEPQFRFHQLYDKVYREDILLHAYRLCRSKGGAAGVDGEDFAAIESYGLECWLGKLTHGGRAGCGAAQSPTDWLGQLLLPGSGEYGVSSGGCPHPVSAALVVVCEAQAQRSGDDTLPRRVPL
jgi:hypothetical protein